MRNIENSGTDEDDRVMQALREVVPDVALDDLYFEQLARKVNAAGEQRLRWLRVARHKVRLQWTGSFFSAGLAASAIFALIIMHTTPAPSAEGSGGSVSASVVTEPADRFRENRRALFAASEGAISADEFLSNVWGHVDAETLLRGDRE